jgi:hypothetical protein
MAGFESKELIVGVIHGFLNFFNINLIGCISQSIQFSVLEVNPQKIFENGPVFFFYSVSKFFIYCRQNRYSTKRPSQLSATFQDTGICIILYMIGSILHSG